MASPVPSVSFAPGAAADSTIGSAAPPAAHRRMGSSISYDSGSDIFGGSFGSSFGSSSEASEFLSLVTDVTVLGPTAEEAAQLPSAVGIAPDTLGTFSAKRGLSYKDALPLALASHAEEEGEGHGEEAKEQERETVRPLGGFERFFGTFSSMGIGLIYFIVDVTGPVDTQTLQRAMRMAVKHHPNLRSHLVKGGLKAVPFSRCPAVKVARVESEDVLAWTEAQLNNSYRLKQAAALYPWSLHLHHTPSTGQDQLVFLIHHAFSDGDSINHLLQELAVNMSKQHLHRLASRSRLVLEQSVLPQLPSADQQLQHRVTGGRCLHFLSAWWTNIKRSIAPGRVPDPVAHVPFGERSTCISSFTVDPPELKLVLAACKAHGTTLTGALSAACAQEMEALINKEDAAASAAASSSDGTNTPGTSNSSSSSTNRHRFARLVAHVGGHSPARAGGKAAAEEGGSRESWTKALTSVMGFARSASGHALGGLIGGGGDGKAATAVVPAKEKKYMIRMDVLVNFRSKALVDAANAPNATDAAAAANTSANVIGQSHQLYAAPVDIMLRAGNTPATAIKFWEAAKQVRAEVVAFLEQPHQVIDTLGLMNTLGGTAFGRRKMAQLANSRRQGRSRALSISNLGVTDKLFERQPSAAGGFAIGKTQWGIDEGFVGHSIFLAVASYGGALHFTLSYSPSIFTREMAQAFGEGIISRLHQAATAEA